MASRTFVFKPFQVQGTGRGDGRPFLPAFFLSVTVALTMSFGLSDAVCYSRNNGQCCSNRYSGCQESTAAVRSTYLFPCLIRDRIGTVRIGILFTESRFETVLQSAFGAGRNAIEAIHATRRVDRHLFCINSFRLAGSFAVAAMVAGFLVKRDTHL